MNQASLIAILSIIVVAIVGYIPIRMTVRSNQRTLARDAAKDKQDAIDVAVAEVRRQMLERLQDKENERASMEKERNGYRDRYFNLMEERKESHD